MFDILIPATGSKITLIPSNTTYIRKEKSQTLLAKNIHENVFQPKICNKKKYSAWDGKEIFLSKIKKCSSLVSSML